MLSGPVVRVVPLQPHCFAFGGFELQMIAAMESAREVGANIAPLDFWRREPDFDVVHLWGLDLQHSHTVKWASAGGKKIIVSALVSYPGWKTWFRHLASSLIGPARLRRPMLKMIDRITVVNEAQALYMRQTVRFPGEQIAVVPNVVDDVFFGASTGSDHLGLGIENYVICTGNVCRRKNQLALIAACRKLGVSLLLVGRTLTGEEDYGRAVAEAISSVRGFRWVQGMTPGSAELAEAYQGATVFALPSFEEQQPISALEAAACGKPLVLGKLSYAMQEFYQGAALADPSSVDDIAVALRKALDRPDAHRPPASVIDQCRRGRVGAAYLSLYEQVLPGVRREQDVANVI